MKEDYILKKWLNDDLSPMEQAAFDEEEDAALNKAILETAQRFKAPVAIGMSKEKIVGKNDPTVKEFKKTSISLTQWLSGIAALLVFSIGMYTWLSNGTTTISTEIAQTESITLPDASQVILNVKSQLSYSSSSWEDNRLINLDGEAFFDVEKGSRFDVKTSKGIISVLGTEFNVRQRGEVLEVTCYEGKVQVSSGDVLQIITVGERVILRDSKLTKNLIKQTYPEWRDDLSRFKNTRLDEVFAELERHYKVKIELENVEETTLFSGAFEHSNLEVALQSITQPLVGVTYKIENNGIIRILNAQ